MEKLDATRPCGGDPLYGSGATPDVWIRETREKVNEIIDLLNKQKEEEV